MPQSQARRILDQMRYLLRCCNWYLVCLKFGRNKLVLLWQMESIVQSTSVNFLKINPLSVFCLLVTVDRPSHQSTFFKSLLISNTSYSVLYQRSFLVGLILLGNFWLVSVTRKLSSPKHPKFSMIRSGS